MDRAGWVQLLRRCSIGKTRPANEKTPKLYFHDTGLAAGLLGITNADTMNVHPIRGELFENPCIADFGKHLRHTGAAGSMNFLRDNIGNEVDLLIERAGVLTPVEFRAGATFQPDGLRGLRRWPQHAAAAPQAQPLLVCGAPDSQQLQGVGVAHWRDALMALVPR